MVSSLVAGTLALYTTSIDNLADGSVVAKEFIFTGIGTDSFLQGIKIAPTETVQWQFKVKNYENHVITETDLYYKLTFNIRASENKSAIEPLIVTVKDLEGRILNRVTGVGSFDVFGSFRLSETGQEKDYIVQLDWPGDRSNDHEYAGGNYGTSIKVDAVASQLPLNGGTEPENQDISVRYETTAPWQNGQSNIYEFAYKVTITNNTDTTIEDWAIEFTLPNDILSNVWSNAKFIHGLPKGSYKFIDPDYNNQLTDEILPGKSVSFGGLARGLGIEAIENIIVSGSNMNPTSNVGLTCEFGKGSL